MSLAETIYRHSLRLPEQAAQEALDFIEFLEQRYSKAQTMPKAPDNTEAFIAAVAGTLGDDSPNDIAANKKPNASDFLPEDAGDDVSPLYRALKRIGFIGCIDADEKLSIRYKDEIDFSNKYGEKP